MPRALVHGLAIAGEATARALLARGYQVVAADDAPGPRAREAAAALGLELVEAPDAALVDRLVRDADLVAPSPGVPETHPVVAAAVAHERPLRTEIDLAYEWERERPGGPRPMVAVTGTDGKTTTTTMVAALLEAGGHRALAAGNTEVPLVTAIARDDVDAFAVECSSFRLSWTTCFRAEAAIWLNLAPDHQNWHRSMSTYEAAKANIWRHQRAGDVAVGWADDPVVRAHLARAPARRVTFGLHGADWSVTAGADGDVLAGPLGAVAPAAALRRRFPHDLSDALAAVAACVESGLVAPDKVEAGLRAYRFPPHRIEPVGEGGGVTWWDDSKATTPHAALTAIRAFDRLVLIAGGRNKDLDLRPLAGEPERVRAVVAIGEAAAEVAAAFEGVRPVRCAASMREAVAVAASLAGPGDAVLLSPACASFDWYPDGGYPARGADFRREVEAHLGRTSRGGT